MCVDPTAAVFLMAFAVIVGSIATSCFIGWKSDHA